MKKIINTLIKQFLVVFCLVIVSACSSSSIDYTQIDNALKVDNITMSMNEAEVFDSVDNEYENVPCVLGKEFKFSDIKLSVVFDEDKGNMIRLKTENKNSSLYGIKVNDKVDQVRKLILEDGFTNEANSDFRFINDTFRITIISVDEKIIDGYMIDVLAAAE